MWRTKGKRAATMTIVTVLALAGCGDDGENSSRRGEVTVSASIKVAPAFGQRAEIPTRYTCEGEGVSPPLRWSQVPKDARAMALLVTDRDAPGGSFFHWTLWNFDRRQTKLAAGRTPRGAIEGENSFGKLGYGPPCPPEGDDPHRYVFSVYALRRPLPLSRGTPAGQVFAAVRATATARGQVVGRFAR
jgi:Raf kinase inhibitor-like YbhB/YbcL family protein